MFKKEVKLAPETLTSKSLRRTRTLLNLQSLRAVLIDPFRSQKSELYVPSR